MANATVSKLTMSTGLASPPRTPSGSPRNQPTTPSPTGSDIDFASRPPLRTPFAHIYRVVSKPPSGPTAHRNSLYVNSPSPPTPTHQNEIHPAFRRKTPRHVPIVITQDLVNRVVERKSFKQRLLEQNKAVQKRLFASGASKGQPELSSEPLLAAPVRPRHIPIVVPHVTAPLIRPRPDLSPPLSVDTGGNFASFGDNPFACRVGTAPPTPTDSQGGTPRASVVNIKRPSTPPSVMSRPTTGHGPGPSSDGTNAGTQYRYDTEKIPVSMSNSQLSFTSDAGRDESREGDLASPPASARTVTSTDPRTPSSATSNNFSGLTCNVHRCTGKEPRGLVGATTTILGDKLYVFGGRSLSRRRPHMTADLYELDLIHRHWSKIKTSGQTPSPRYFHSVCALGDSKLICYGGMSPAPSNPAGPQSTPNAEQPDVVVMSDVHIYDTKTRVWTKIETQDTPQGRYAHCAAVLPSTAVFSSPNAPLSAIHHNPSEGDNPNAGQLGIALDGTGGAEMVVVGGQDNANHYIEQISVFNLRSLKWTATNSLGRSCGAYRSVVAPLVGFPASKIGAGVDAARNAHKEGMIAPDGNSMLIYSNYNFLDVKLELQCRTQDGRLEEKPMGGPFSPPGLRFPNGGVLNNHFVISGTYLTSSRQEYALWALDLRTQTWSRIDVGGSVFGSGSWNRGVLWPRRNTFVILGNRKRNLVDDYNHRRINFTNICLVELEAFGLYDNPRLASPTSAYQSYSAPELPASLRPKASLWSGGGRPHFTAAEELGKMALNLRELSDMDILTLNGEKVPANSHVLARRWGAFFVKTMREGANASGAAAARSLDGMSPTADDKDANTIRNAAGYRNSSVTITPSIATAYTTSTNLTVGSAGSTGTATLGNGSMGHAASNSIASGATTLTNGTTNGSSDETGGKPFHAPSPATLPASSRSRTLYLPHTAPTVHALLHYLYTNTLPPPGHALSTPQILCSLLQLARPYRIDGLLEAVLQRLHQVMDGRSAAAVFNACAMAAGGGRGTGFDKLFDGAGNLALSADDLDAASGDLSNGASNGVNGANSNKFATGAAAARARQSMANGRGRGAMERKNTFDVGDGPNGAVNGDDSRRNGSTASAVSARGRSDSTDASEDEEAGTSGTDTEGGSVTDSSDMWDDPIGGVPGPGTTNGVEEEVWTGDRSCVIGLQKRGLRGLMEGRRMRERGESVAASSVKGSLR